MKLLNNKAYTLSEFVLIVILAAIFCVLVFLTHKRQVATEQARQAEAFMRAVRYEQEDRCAAGMKYAVYAKNLKTFIKKKQGTKRISYDLTSGMGIVARSKVYDYALKMPSYADGRICCDNCENLTRHYAPCSSLLRRKDFVQVDVECAFYPEKVVDANGQPVFTATEQETTPQQAQQSEESASSENTAASLPAVAVSEAEQPQAPAQEPQAPSEQVATIPSSETEESTSSQEAQSAAQAEAETPTPSECPVPSKGNFFIEQCDTYEKGTQGAVLFAWNPQTCAYDATQNCLIPARWKKGKTITREEKGVYPSDLDKLCSQLLEQMGCADQAAPDKECFEVDESCYSSCEITSQTPVQESKTIVLYDVTLSVRNLQCSPSKNVTVTLP